jgi:hypothetical protein
MNTRPLAILDLSCLKYGIYFRGCKNFNLALHFDGGRPRPEVVTFWKADLAHTLASIASAVAEHSKCKPLDVIIAGAQDAPNGKYWRHSVFSFQQTMLDEPLRFKSRKGSTKVHSDEYKGGRLAKSEYNEFMQVANKVIAEVALPTFFSDWAEADDITGLFAELKPEAQPLYVVSLDHDWKLLCDYPNTYFVNLHRTKFLEITDGSLALEDFQDTYPKAGIETLLDVPHAKAEKGERSDNLPPGFDHRLADLVNYSCPEPEDFAEVGPEFTWSFSQIKQEIQNFLEERLQSKELVL